MNELLNKIKSVKLCMMAHPDNEQDSEFDDRISDLEEIENELLLNGWIDANKETPELIKDEDYSENVLAVCNGRLSVMCYCYIPGEYGGFVWANCNEKIDGDAEFDDNYEVTHWQRFPSLPKLESVGV